MKTRVKLLVVLLVAFCCGGCCHTQSPGRTMLGQNVDLHPPIIIAASNTNRSCVLVIVNKVYDTYVKTTLVVPTEGIDISSKLVGESNVVGWFCPYGESIMFHDSMNYSFVFEGINTTGSGDKIVINRYGNQYVRETDTRKQDMSMIQVAEEEINGLIDSAR
jgi:hypothetical protein